jgi:hypothetical protein
MALHVKSSDIPSSCVAGSRAFVKAEPKLVEDYCALMSLVFS